MTTVLSAVPIIPARDTEATSAWYRDRLGFSVRHVEREYAIVVRDGVEIHFWGPSDVEPDESTAMFRLQVRGIGALHAVCMAGGMVHPQAGLERKPWGSDEFAVRDLDGNLVTFFERMDRASA